MSGSDDQPPVLNDKTLETPGSARGNILLAQDDLILNLTKQIQTLSDELAAIKGQAPQNVPLNANPVHNVPTYQNNPLNQTPPPQNRPQVSQNTPPAQQNTQPAGYPSYYPYPNDPTPPHYQYLPAKDTPRPPQSQAPIPVAVAPPNANDPRQGYPEALYYEHDPNGKNVDFTDYQPQNEMPTNVEKQGKTSEQEEIIQAMKAMQQSIKDLQVTKKRQSTSYRSLYLFPDITPPPGFKVPKFDMYDGHGDPFAHLTKYLNRMRAPGGKEELLMAYFNHSLEGIAAEWFARQDISKWHEFDDIAGDFTKQFEYNVAMVPDLITLANLKKKPTETFREYALRWREQAARVQPPMTERDMVKYFIRAQDDSYYMHMLPMMGAPYAELLTMGEMVEEGIKSGRIVSFAEMKSSAQNAQASPNNSRRREKREEVTAVAADIDRRPARRLNFDNPPVYPTYQNTPPH